MAKFGCKLCGLESDDAELFSVSKKSKTGRRPRCKPCYSKEMYRYAKGFRKRKHDALKGLRSGACMDCGEVFPTVCMDFDHRDPSQKSFTIGAVSTLAMARVLAEIEKCDLVCANCHRIRTWNQRHDEENQVENPRMKLAR